MATKVAQLIQLLSDKTASNEIRWERTEKEGIFQHAFPKYTVRLSTRYIPDLQAQPDYVVTIYSQEGEVIEEIADPQAEEEGVENAFEKMRETYETARRQAMGVDEALDSILGYLGENKTDDQ